MGIAGAAFGASNALEEIVAQRILKQKLEQEISERQERAELEGRRVSEMETQNRWERERAGKLDAERKAAADKAAEVQGLADRGRRNMAGVVAMGVDPSTARREIAFSSLQSGADVPSGVMDAIAPKRKEYTYTDPKTGAKSLRYADPDQGEPIDLGREPEKPERGSPPNYLTLIDGQGNQRRVPDGANVNQLLQQGWRIFDPVAARTTQGAGINPTKAAETRRNILNAATALKGSGGLGSMTGARGMS
jgi:hypothetical protein